PLVAGESGPVEDLDPLSALALKRFITTHSVVPDLPVQLSLRRFAAIRISAERTEAQALARSIVAQAATFHAPTDLQVLLCTAAPDGPAWGWAKWLPHAQHPTEVDHAGPVRTIGRSLVELEAWLGSELTRRPRFNRHAEPDPELPHLLVVLDGGACTGAELMLGSGGLAAVTVVDLDGGASELADRHGLTLVVDDGTLSVQTGEQLDGLGQADLLAGATAEALARQLAAYRLDVATARAEDLTTTDQTLPALLNIPDPGSIDLATLWRPRPTRDHLTVPIGMAADGERLELDIKESAQDGMGPHGLVVGATGSGKSELLRTLVLGMATTHPPDLLNLVLVDFKGGATFAGMSALPHVAAVITNLENDLSLVDRMQEALAGEMNRRQEILRDAGNLVSVRDYERARTRGADLPALPSLFIVVDEFSELLAQKPDFAHLFVQIGRLGRSLGLHLLLASQRLEESKLRGLEAHLSYRIGLRTFSEQESRMAIGTVDAHHLPQAPGHGYLRTDTSTLRRFRAAYVSGPHRTGNEQVVGALSGTVDVRRFTAAPQPVPAQLHQRAPQPVIDPDDGDGPDLPTVLGVMVDQMIGRGTGAHQVWLPPLDHPESLDRLFPVLRSDPARGFGAPPDSSPALQVPIGLVDRPYHQRRDPLLVDAAGSGGHIAVVGGPRSGKSTMIRTVLAALALRHTPQEVQFFALDFGGALIGLADLPHLSGLASRLDSEVVHRIVAEVTGIVEDREGRFRELGVDSMATYRQLQAQGQVPDDRFGDVFLAVDGWGVLRQHYEDLEHELLGLIGRSLNYGVHIVISCHRWLELRLGLRDLIGTKIELKLGDALDSEFDRKIQLTVPENRPGRGATRDKLHFLGALPRIDGRRSDADLSTGIADLTRTIRDGWPGEPAPKVRLLPVSYGFEEVPLAAKQDGVVIGIEGHRLEPVIFRAGHDAGAIVIGDTECGKTSLLRAVARQVIERGDPEQAKIILFDFRLTMLREFSGDQVLDYVTTSQQAIDAVAGLMKGFTKR
ncbi:MAG: type VII secretion protein EccCa, partial [Pseudonocardiaceae bacterium]